MLISQEIAKPVEIRIRQIANINPEASFPAWAMIRQGMTVAWYRVDGCWGGRRAIARGSPESIAPVT